MSADADWLIAKYTKQLSSYTRLLAVSTIILTLITAVIALLTYQMTANVAVQTKTIHDELTEMQSSGRQTDGLIAIAGRQADAAEEGVRAWIRPTLVHFEGPITKGVKAWIKIHYRNFGRLPAEKFNHITQHELFPASLATDEAEKKVSMVHSCFAKALADRGNVVIPKERERVEDDAYHEDFLSAQDVNDDLLNGDKYLLLAGCYTFSNGLHTRHASFCFYFQRGKTPEQSFANCNYGNEDD